MSPESREIDVHIEQTVVVKGPDHPTMYFPDTNSAVKRIELTELRDRFRTVVYLTGGIVSVGALMSMPRQTEFSLSATVESVFLFIEFGASVWFFVKSAGYLGTDEEELEKLRQIGKDLDGGK